jgi:ABC-type proline/glycine betaine transport system substrate-binding protein
MANIKCRSKNPSACVDPQCPELRGSGATARFFSNCEKREQEAEKKAVKAMLAERKKAEKVVEDYRNERNERIWTKGGKLHRVGGPAIIYSNGSGEYWENGLKHRTDGPAVVWADGTQEWCQNGKLHRLDGPAIIYPDGTQEWWVDGKKTKTEIDGKEMI